jgi:outer membrane protein OmpA-like peptidoglycan-associated protein
MKKSFLSIAVTMALSSAVFSASALSTQAHADGLVIDDNNNSNSNATENYMYPGMGVGAATGTLIAGPAGFLVGGVIGAIVGSNQAVTQDSEDRLQQQNDIAISPAVANTAIEDKKSTEHLADISPDSYSASSGTNTPADDSVQVAQLGTINTIADDNLNPQQETLMNILVTDLSLDVYFRTGSTEIEKFYPARLAAIADLINTMDKLELHLDGYTDRRGNQSQNLSLANKRLDKVRQQLINAGVEDSRIISKAFGEAKMKSSAGDLDAYTFDRRVVIRFERTVDSADKTMTTALSETDTDNTTASITENQVDVESIESVQPVMADISARF